eukprot:12786609-Alexandrium_andersonii.AAC.1
MAVSPSGLRSPDRVPGTDVRVRPVVPGLLPLEHHRRLPRGLPLRLGPGAARAPEAAGLDDAQGGVLRSTLHRLVAGQQPR